MRVLSWIVASITAINLMFGLQVAHALEGPIYDCVVKGAASSTSPVYDSESDKAKVVSNVPGGSVFYTPNRIPYFVDSDRFRVHRFNGKNDFAQIGFMKSENLDCDGDGITAEYPIVIRNDKELGNALGLVADHEQTRKIRLEKNKCFWKGEADLVVSMSDTFLEPYKRIRFPFDILCISLKAGDQIRFDPETGERMPTYSRLGTSFNQEYLLIPPVCLARGRFESHNDGGQVCAELNPIGCRFNFHPWSGRKLDPEVGAVLAKIFGFIVGGAAGAVNEDSKLLAAQAPGRILTLAKINALRDQMKKK
jgi:hypothetical protein